ncbi:MAG: 2'-5' RNA ligase family protein [Bacteroidia bacterium]
MAAKRIYNQTALFGPLYAYLVVLSPPQKIIDAITGIKRDMNAIADITERNLHSKAHITLTDKLTDDAGFAETVETFIGEQKEFTVTVDGWGVFDHGHSITIYLKVVTPEPIVHLAQTLRSKATTPHISLAKKIPYPVYEKLLPWLQHLQYTATWPCNEVVVLRKLMSEKHLGFKESFVISFKTTN